MSDYNKLAQRILAQGIGWQGEYPKSCDGVGFYHIGDEYSEGMIAELFCQDGRVVLALMEKVWSKGIHLIIEKAGIIVPLGITPNGETISTGAVVDESLAVAICEACCEALEEDDE